MQPKEITALQDAIRSMHGCESDYRRTQHVREPLGGEDAWDGLVRIFRITHALATRCYAWSYQEGDQTKYVAVLEIPSIDSAGSAVQAAIAARTRQK
jgi:hypothetical protein